LIATGTNLDIRRLVLRSALFVIASSLVYALLIYAALPLLEHSLFAGKFRNLWSLTIWWVAYFMLTGITTVASSVLRSALEFRQVFYRQALSCVAAVVLLTIGLRLNAIESLVIALVIVEFISAGLFWHRLSTTVSLRHKSA
jgi:O-antigen/teichoic acid export membrane protein